MGNQNHVIPVTNGNWFFSEKVRVRLLEFSFPLALILGTIGYLQYHTGGEAVSFTNALYHSVQLFILHSAHFERPVPPALELARWLAAASTILLVANSVIWLLQQERTGLKLRYMKNHTLVCGLGGKGRAVVSELCGNHRKIVVIDKDPDQETTEWLRRLKIPLLVGDARRDEILLQGRIHYASALFALCPDDQVNCETALKAGTLPVKNPGKLDCLIHVNDHDLRISIQNLLKNSQFASKLNFRFADAFLPEAIHLLTKRLPLDHNGISPDSPYSVRLVVIGFGRMGRTIAKVAAQLGQFANRKSLEILVIDKEADQNRDAFFFHYPYFTKAANISFFRHDIQSPEARNLLETCSKGKNTITSVVFCIDNEPLILDSVMTLMPVIGRENFRIAVRMRESGSIVNLLNAGQSGLDMKYALVPFGNTVGLRSLTQPDMDENGKMAGIIHELYASFRKHQLNDRPEESEIRKLSGFPGDWDSLDEDLKESCRQQAAHLGIKLRALGYEMVDSKDSLPEIETFTDEKIELLAELEHRRWMAERTVNGWKVGKEKNMAKKTSPWLVDWDMLPENIRDYDRNFIRMIPAIVRKSGKKIIGHAHKQE